MITITKRFEFCYGHFLPEYEGKCKNQHGHNAELEVTVSAVSLGIYDYMVIDFSKLKEVVMFVIEKVDHKNLNDILADTIFMPPVVENLIGWFIRELEQALPNYVQLEEIRLSEASDSWATWRRG